MFQAFFTQRALKEQLGTPRAIERHLGTRHSKGTWTLTHSKHLATWSIRHRGTRALEGILDTRGILFSRLRIFNVDCNNRECINKRNCGSFFSETHEEFVNFFSPLFYLMIFPFFSFDETAFIIRCCL